MYCIIKVKKHCWKNKRILELSLKYKKNVYLNQSAAHLTSYLPHKRPARRKNYKKKKKIITFRIFLSHSKYLSFHSKYFLLHSKYFYRIPYIFYFIPNTFTTFHIFLITFQIMMKIWDPTCFDWNATQLSNEETILCLHRTHKKYLQRWR